MDGEAELRKYARLRPCYLGVLPMVGKCLQDKEDFSFHSMLLTDLRHWQTWFHCLFKDIEDHIPEEEREIFNAPIHHVYHALNFVCNQVEHDMHTIIKQPREMTPTEYMKENTVKMKSQQLEVNGIILLHRLSLLSSRTRRPVPTEGHRWEAMLPFQDYECLRYFVDQYKKDMKSSLIDFYRDIGDAVMRGVKPLEIKDYTSLLTQTRSEENEAAVTKRLKEISEVYLDSWSQTMKSNEYQTKILEYMRQQLTTREWEISEDYEMEGRDTLERAWSFVRRFLHLIWAMIGILGSRLREIVPPPMHVLMRLKPRENAPIRK